MRYERCEWTNMELSKHFGLSFLVDNVKRGVGSIFYVSKGTDF